MMRSMKFGIPIYRGIALLLLLSIQREEDDVK